MVPYQDSCWGTSQTYVVLVKDHLDFCPENSDGHMLVVSIFVLVVGLIVLGFP